MIILDAVGIPGKSSLKLQQEKNLKPRKSSFPIVFVWILAEYFLDGEYFGENVRIVFWIKAKPEN